MAFPRCQVSGACYERLVTRVLPILPTMSTLSINCLLLGSDSSEVFEVEILKTKKVSSLKDLIKEKQSPRLNHVVASELTVWKVSLPVDTITPELTVEACKKLQSPEKISSIFGDALVAKHVHILVQAPTGAVHKLFLDLTWHLLWTPPFSIRKYNRSYQLVLSASTDLLRERRVVQVGFRSQHWKWRIRLRPQESYQGEKGPTFF